VLRVTHAAAQPGYFTTTFVNGIKLETTSTRRAGLIRFTYPAPGPNHVVVDLTNDLGRSFEGGALALSAPAGRVKLGGTFLQSYGPSNYTVFACYDFAAPPAAFGTYQSANLSSAPSGNISVTPGGTALSFPWAGDRVSAAQAGALLSFDADTVLARFGVSFHDADRACANAEAEVPDWDWERVQGAAAGAWEAVLARVGVDTAAEDATVVELLYSSVSARRPSVLPSFLPPLCSLFPCAVC
jgi:putative alpha-1,2-mannosidase